MTQLNRTQKASIPVELLTSASELNALRPILSREQAVAIDTESDSMHRYPEKVCLIQIGTRRKIYLIDTLAIRDIRPIGELLADLRVIKVMQGADYDIRCLDRQWGFRIRNIFDTAIAAQFAGIKKFGLAYLTESLLGVKITKSPRLQRSDWSRRPLPPDALDYAAADVLHLPAIHRALERRLLGLGRISWVNEECSRLEQIRATRQDPDAAFLSAKGIGKLDGQARAVFRRLHALREDEARRRNRPPFYILSNEIMVQLASNAKADISKIPQLRRAANSPFGRQLRSALIEGRADPPLKIPRRIREEALTPFESERLRRLKDWRNSEAKSLGIEPSLIWPMISLDKLARSKGSLRDEIQSPEVRDWQRKQFQDSLLRVLSSNSNTASMMVT